MPDAVTLWMRAEVGKAEKEVARSSDDRNHVFKEQCNIMIRIILQIMRIPVASYMPTSRETADFLAGT